MPPYQIAALILTAISVFIAVASYLRVRQQDIDQVRKGLASEIQSILDRLVRLETRSDFVWSILERKALDILHHPDPEFRRVDELIDKYRDNHLDPDELQEFIHLLDELTTDPQQSKGVQISAILVLAALHRRYSV